MIVRERLYASLFATLVGATGVTTCGRRLQHWSEVTPSAMPALFLVQKSETPRYRLGLPPRWTLLADVYVYACQSDPSQPPAPLLNGLLDAIEAALAPDPVHHVQTLGGLCSHCTIAGTVATDEGTLGDVAVAIVPIEIILS